MSDTGTIRRPSAFKCLFYLSLTLILLLGACENSGADSTDGSPAGGSQAIGVQTGALEACPRPDEGCACEVGSDPVDCYRAPSESPSGQSCGVGKRHCRDGVWGGCDDVRFIEISRRKAYLAPGFQHCDLYDPDVGVLGCNPDCFIAEDNPNPWDLSEGNSDGGIFRSTDQNEPPGIYLGTDGSGTGDVVDTDGDGFPDEVDACPTVAGGVDSSGNFGCPGGDGIGVYVEADSASGASPGMLPTPDLNQLPAPPLDVYFLLDTSTTVVGIEVKILGITILSRSWDLTMDQPMADLAANFGIFDSTIRSSVPNIRYGLGHFNEYQAWSLYGDPGNAARAYQHDRPIATYSVAQMQSFINAARADRARGSGDSAAFGIGDIIGALFGVWRADLKLEANIADYSILLWDLWVRFENFELLMPESHTQALWSIATRNGLPWANNPVASASGTCAGGGFGYPCFRSEAIPVVVLVTDDVQHNGPLGDPGSPAGKYPYDKSYTPLAVRGGGPLNIKTLPGNGTPSNPRQLPNNPHEYFRRFSGNTDGMGRNDDSTPCGGNWNGSDEFSTVTVTQAGTYRLRVERVDFNSGFLGNDEIGVALYGPNGSTVQLCAKGNGPHDMNVHLTPGTYRIRIDGGRSGILWHARGSYNFYFGRPEAPTKNYNEVRDALTAQGIRVVGLHGCTHGTISTGNTGLIRIPPCVEQSGALDQLRELARVTGGVNTISGQPIVPSVNVGAGGAANAISQLAEGIATMIQEHEGDILIRALDNPGTAFDERNFINDLVLRVPPGPIPASCGALNPATASVMCTAPVGVQFRAEVDVKVDPGAAPPGLYEFNVEVVNVADNTVLATIPVKVLIRPEITLEPGSYWRDYDASVFDPSLPPGAPLCNIGGETGLRPDWLNLRWVADTPSNSSGGSFIEFNIKTADNSSGLSSGSDVCVRIPETAPHKTGCVRLPADGADARIDVGRALVEAGSSNYRHLLRVTSTLYPTPDGKLSPFLYDMNTSYACTPFE